MNIKIQRVEIVDCQPFLRVRMGLLCGAVNAPPMVLLERRLHPPIVSVSTLFLTPVRWSVPIRPHVRVRRPGPVVGPHPILEVRRRIWEALRSCVAMRLRMPPAPVLARHSPPARNNAGDPLCCCLPFHRRMQSSHHPVVIFGASRCVCIYVTNFRVGRKKMRWALCTDDIFYANPVLKNILKAGRTMPIKRTKGMEQPLFKVSETTAAVGGTRGLTRSNTVVLLTSFWHRSTIASTTACLLVGARRSVVDAISFCLESKVLYVSYGARRKHFARSTTQRPKLSSTSDHEVSTDHIRRDSIPPSHRRFVPNF